MDCNRNNPHTYELEPRRLPILLRHAWFSLNQTFRRRIAHTGATPDQFTVLRTLWENTPDGLRACLENGPAMSLRARRAGWQGATSEHIREKSVTEEQRSQAPRPVARSPAIISRHALTQNALTRLMASDPNTVASLLERMERAGWIARQRHETDRRAKRICLLPAGERKFKQVRKIALALQTEVLAGLPKKKREEFLQNLALVASRCRDVASK